MDQYVRPLAMDRQLDVLHCHEDGGLLLAASCLTGRYWLGSLWYFHTPSHAPDVDRCTAGVQLEAGVCDAQWVDRTRVVVALDTGGIAVWNLIDDYHTFVLDHAASGHDDVATGVSVNADRSRIASCSYDKSVKLWDLASVSLLSSYQAHSDMVSCIDCHPSEPDLFSSCGQDGKLLLWDRRKAKPASVLNSSPLRDFSTCVRWQPSETHKLAVGSETGQIALLDTRMGVENYLTSTPHSRLVYRVEFCQNKPSLLASISEDSKTVVTQITEEGMKQTYKDESHSDFVHGLSWSGACRLFTCGWDSKVMSHDIAAGAAKALGDGQEVSVCMNGDVANHTATNGKSKGFGEHEKKGKSVSYSQAVHNGQEMEAEG